MTNVQSHERWEGDAAAYALRALDDDELPEFEAHLAGCQRCREEVAVMRRAAEALPPPSAVELPRELKRRVMTLVQADLRREVSRTPARRRRPMIPWFAVAGAAAAVAVGVVVVVLALGGGSSTHTYAGEVFAPGASASVTVSGPRARLRFSRLPAPPAGHIYEVWLSRAGQSPTPTRALFANSNGSVAVPGNLRGVRMVLVTAEPRPYGSRVPTRAPIIVVRLARS